MVRIILKQRNVIFYFLVMMASKVTRDNETYYAIFNSLQKPSSGYGAHFAKTFYF